MPPQQPDRLLDLFNKAFDFGAHIVPDSAAKGRCQNSQDDVATPAAKRNRIAFTEG